MANKLLLKKSSVTSKVPLTSDLDYGELALNYADGKLFFKNSSNNILSFNSDTSSFVTLTGEQTLSNKTINDPIITGTITGDVVASGNLKSLYSSGDEGGEILLAKPQTNTTLSGTGVVIDVYQNKLRIFEQGGTTRGIYIDLTSTSPGASTNLLAGGGGGGYVASPWTNVSANYTAPAGSKILANTNGGTFTVTLPATPAAGTTVIIADAGSWNITPLIVARNGSTIEGLSEDVNLDVSNIQVEFIYDGTTWEVYAFTGPGVSVSNDATSNLTQYLTMSRDTSGELATAYVADSKLYFNPSTGTLNSTNFNSLSDLTLKTNVQSLNSTLNSLDIIDSIRPVQFNWKDTNKLGYGVIAQEIEAILPNIVESNNETGIKTVGYTQLIPFLLQAIKDLKLEVEALKAAA